MTNGNQILIVEDDPVVGRHIHRLLLNLGYQVTGPVTTGEEAVEKAPQCHPNLILMDISLEGDMDGIQAAEKIRKLEDIPIIYLTALSTDQILSRAKSTNPFGYLIKPFNERDLQSGIEMALNKHKLEIEIRRSENRIRTLFEIMGEGIVLVDYNEVITFANPAAEKIFNVPFGGLVGRSLKEFTSPDNFKKIRKQTELRKLGEKSEYELEITCNDGEKRIVLVTATPLEDSILGYTGGLGVLRDITELKDARERETRQRMLAESLRDVSIELSGTLNLNKLFDLILKNVGKVVPHDTSNIMLIEGDKLHLVRSAHYEKFGLLKKFKNLEFPIPASLDYMRKIQNQKVRIVNDVLTDPNWKDITGTHFIRSNISAPIILGNIVVGFINLDSHLPGFFTQEHADKLTSFAYLAAIAIENARLYEQMQNLAVTDELTGIYNRRGVIESGEKEFNRATRFKHPFALIWIDFDYYKKINDQFGHEMGDRVLKTMIAKCAKKLRDIDSFGRMGGDEFIILLPETDLEGGVMVAERLREMIQKTRMTFGKTKIKVTASFGVTAMSAKSEGFSKMLSAADNAMYAAKKLGRNLVRTS